MSCNDICQYLTGSSYKSFSLGLLLTVSRTCVPGHGRLRAVEIWACLLPFFATKEENNKPTQSRYIIPLFQTTLKAWKKFAGATKHICTYGTKSDLVFLDKAGIIQLFLYDFLKHLCGDNAISLQQYEPWVARKSLQNWICLCGVISSWTFRETPSCCGQMHFTLCISWYWWLGEPGHPQSVQGQCVCIYLLIHRSLQDSHLLSFLDFQLLNNKDNHVTRN